MAAEHQATGFGQADRSRDALNFLHGLLARRGEPSPSPGDLLRDLAAAFAADAAGISALADGAGFCEHFPSAAVARPSLPWAEQPELLDRIRASPAGIVLSAADGVSFLCASVCPRDGSPWLLWVEGKAGQSWSSAEAAALTLAAQVLAHWLGTGQEDGLARARQLEHATQQRRLEDVAAVTRRLAHDYGNVLTSILGFTELSLAQLTGDSPLKRYLGEVHRGGQQGALFTHRLRLFARRPALSARATTLSVVLAGQKTQAAAWSPDIELALDVPDDLPPVALDPDQLHEVLTALLDNAREAIEGAGRVTLTARPVTLSLDECLGLWGSPAAGAFVEVAIHDTGCGLSPDAPARLLREPFYTNKARHRGLGLSIVYGILHSQKGGFCLSANPGGGVTARLYLPVAGPATESRSLRAAQADAAPAAAASILVVDDDPQVLRMVSDALRRVGYQVQTATSATEALALHATARPRPFGLVVSDVVMPETTGVELARRLLSRDNDLRLLFMSGMIGQEALRRDLDGREVGLLTKPFPVEGLLRAVRTALADPTAAASDQPGSSPPSSESSSPPTAPSSVLFSAAATERPREEGAARPGSSRSMQR